MNDCQPRFVSEGMLGEAGPCPPKAKRKASYIAAETASTYVYDALKTEFVIVSIPIAGNLQPNKGVETFRAKPMLRRCWVIDETTRYGAVSLQAPHVVSSQFYC